jgi:hypothetical protein
MSMRNIYRRHPAFVLLLWDVLLAFVLGEAAFMLPPVVGPGVLSVEAVITTVPSVVAWVWMRAALGLYPGYGLAKVEELRQQTFALFATVGIILVFAFASQLGDSIDRVFLFTWALGLLVVAPVVRHYVKASLGVGEH